MSNLKVSGSASDEDLSGIPTVMKWAILGLICLLAFSIRLFAVVRYESVIHDLILTLISALPSTWLMRGFWSFELV